MIDLSAIEGFDWDDGNARKSADKHGVFQTEAEQVFQNQPLLVVEDTKHSALEIRYHALGTTNSGRHLHITFVLWRDNTLIRIISARAMNRKERHLYEEAP